MNNSKAKIFIDEETDKQIMEFHETVKHIPLFDLKFYLPNQVLSEYERDYKNAIKQHGKSTT